MASIGSVSCDFVKGAKTDLKERLEIWQVAGIAGFGAQKLGKGDSAFRFIAVKIDTKANISTWAGNIEDVSGTIVTITDDWAVAHTNCLVVSVSAVARTPRIGTNNCRGEIEIRGVKTS